jgi:hypothetical protein
MCDAIPVLLPQVWSVCWLWHFACVLLCLVWPKVRFKQNFCMYVRPEDSDPMLSLPHCGHTAWCGHRLSSRPTGALKHYYYYY